MKRNLFITIDPSETNSDHVHIGQIDNIINNSCDSIAIDCLEYLVDKDHPLILTHLLNKIRIHGRLIIQSKNAENIASRFLKKTISHKEFLDFFTNKRSLVSVESIYSLIDFKLFDIIDLNITDDSIKIILERKTYE